MIVRWAKKRRDGSIAILIPQIARAILDQNSFVDIFGEISLDELEELENLVCDRCKRNFPEYANIVKKYGYVKVKELICEKCLKNESRGIDILGEIELW